MLASGLGRLTAARPPTGGCPAGSSNDSDSPSHWWAPELVFVDDAHCRDRPTGAAYDVELSRRRVRTDGVTVVLTTHHMDEASTSPT